MREPVTARRFLAGDREVVEEVRRWVRAALTSYRRRLADELEDLELESLVDLTVALRSGSFESRSSFKSYVKSFAVYKGIDRVRSRSRRHWVDIEELEFRSEEPSALDLLSRQELARLALRVAEEMSEECRELWRLIQAGMSYQEMASRLGVAAGTLRVRVLRCRKKAREIRDSMQSAEETPS